MNIILMGYRCTGKTSAGLRLASILNRPFFDTDELILHRSGRTVEDIVAEGGWEAFRNAERHVIRNLSLLDGGVIASGGGAFLDARNVESLKRNGFFVWLVANVETIVQRLEKDKSGINQRPSLSGKAVDEEVEDILAQREPIYRRIADLIVATDFRSLEEVVAEIRRELPEPAFKSDRELTIAPAKEE